MSKHSVDKSYRMSKGLKTFLAFLPPEDRGLWKKMLSGSESFAKNVRKTLKVKIVKEDENEQA